MGDVVMWFRRKEKPMFKEIESFSEKVAAKVKAAEDEVKDYFNSIKYRAVDQFKFDINHFETTLTEEGIKIDDEFADDLAKIKAKLKAEEEALNPPEAS
jgi:phage host-nuclease inhibitor protein Gam